MQTELSTLKRLTIPLALVAILIAGCAATQPSAKQTQGKEDMNIKMVIRVVLQVKDGQSKALVEYMEGESKEALKLKGCERYSLYQDPQKETSFLLYEEWTSAADFAAYQKSDLLKKSFQVIGPMMAGPPDSAYFEAKAVGP